MFFNIQKQGFFFILVAGFFVCLNKMENCTEERFGSVETRPRFEVELSLHSNIEANSWCSHVFIIKRTIRLHLLTMNALKISYFLFPRNLQRSFHREQASDSISNLKMWNVQNFVKLRNKLVENIYIKKNRLLKLMENGTNRKIFFAVETKKIRFEYVIPVDKIWWTFALNFSRNY